MHGRSAHGGESHPLWRPAANGGPCRDHPPRSTVQRYFYCWRGNGTWRRMNHAFVRRAREAAGRGAIPSLGIIDSQSVKTTESGGPRGLDVFKRIKERKRHIVTDSQGFLLASLVHGTNVQDSHGAVPLLKSLTGSFPKLRHIFADRVYRGPKLISAISHLGLTIEIVKRPQGVKGFQLLPRRWVVERTFAWFGRNRRLRQRLRSHYPKRRGLAHHRQRQNPTSRNSLINMTAFRVLL